MFDLQYKAPSRDLTGFVSAFYLFRTDEPRFSDQERADIAQFRCVIRGHGEIDYGAYKMPICPNSLFGPRSKATHVNADGPALMLGLGLLPAGWHAMTGGLDARTAANRILDADLICPELARHIKAAASQEETLDAMVATIEPHVRNAIQAGPITPLWFIEAVDEWLAQDLLPRFDDLIETTGLSRRKADSMIRSLYGAAPNLLIRKYRALRVANLMAHGEGDWQDFVGDAFYDQSHCIRELKYFIGLTPGSVREARSRLVSLAFNRRRLSGSVNRLTAET